MNDTSPSGENAKFQLRADLELLEQRIEELKVNYEQYFIDVVTIAPETERANVERMIRRLRQAPFKNATMQFKLNSLVQRFNTYKSYWERTLKQREAGTYAKDQFKAKIRKKGPSIMSAKANDPQEAAMKKLFNKYVDALICTGAPCDNLDFDKFKGSLNKKTKSLKEEHGFKKVDYKVVVKGGKVSVKTTTK